MGHTFHQLRYHIVFATKERHPWIDDEIQVPLYRYMRSIIERQGGHPLEVGGVADHVHILTGLKPSVAPADLVQEVKGSSSRWLSVEFDRVFAWQPGYGIFSVSESRAPAVARYIRRQEQHHQNQSFAEEWQHLLDGHGLTSAP